MITLVVGGQYGGEGKGKITAFLSRKEKFYAVCRTGGINSKHTAVTNGKIFNLRQIPTAVTSGFNGKVVYGAGSLVHIQTLKEEMKILNMKESQILIDFQTGILTDSHIYKQRTDARYQELGSTLTGTGYASSERALRKLILAKDFSELSQNLGNVSNFLYKALSKNKNILVEGHQSSGLSNFHGDYPYVSNRDSTAAEMLSELGIGPRYKMRIILVLKVFPTRNHNGYLPNEMSEDEADALGIAEYGGGSKGITNKRRRVGRIDINDIKHSVYLNTPTEIALTGIDYLDNKSKDSTSFNNLSVKAKSLIKKIEKSAGIPVTMVSTGAETNSMIYRI